MTTVAQFTIKFRQTLNACGQLNSAVGDLSQHGIGNKMLLRFYRAMHYARLFDTKAIALQRTGRLGTYASCLGQEAIGAAVGVAMKDSDVFVQSYRETTTLLERGVKAEEILLYWGGDERGMDFAHARQDMPAAVPIASQCCHSVGIAYALQLRKQPRVAVVMLGDGATSKGDFYESLNAAGVWQLPLVFIICNNQWAISLPRSAQSHCQTLAQKAIAGGISAEQVDGNDVIGSYLAVNKAIENARAGNGPHLIEALTYRLSDHTTADDAQRYRSEQELAEAWQQEPIARLTSYLLQQQIADQQQLDGIDQKCQQQLDQSVDKYLNAGEQQHSSIFDFLYQKMPKQLRQQLSQLHKNNQSGGGE
ncbi:Pyruvate dehydrogenase E1 component subunit alpha [Sinobacterium norvegicum]|uniref:Pyruvate dehydrogenase E1 component subunit alpha n=1 Tax=Sinobacterium norvegicum TaxID=1641715 RepID=A0ABN8EG21_9GAMM|nr:pyruvate dehydrogenase (acetyl-transferring) E1 component subunit alpha [Sinobacterium norvegicum]CAH0991292.1 Pyruvate dehydrogenase E1 component subunit alpha [Sinobacterium norvegicum]